MANTRASTRNPSAVGNEKTSEYHVTIGSNNGQVIAGNNNSITTFNVYSYLSAGETKKRKTSKRNKKKKRRSENVEADSSQNSKNSEAVKGEDERKKVRRKSHVLNDEQSCEGSANEEVKYQDNEFTTSEEEWSDMTAGNHLMSGTAKESKKAKNLSSSYVTICYKEPIERKVS